MRTYVVILSLMSAVQSAQEAIEYVRSKWPEPEALAIACIGSAAVLAAVLPGLYRLYAMAASTLLIAATWLAGRRIPRFRRGCFGFLVSVYCDGDPHTLRLVRSDFIQPLRELVREGSTGPQFRIRELPQHLARRALEPENALKLLRVSHARFMLVGKTRKRTARNTEKLYLNLRGAVAHKHIPTPTQEKLRAEFTRLLPSHAQMDLDHELLVFELTSSVVSVVSKYVMAIATGLSGNLDNAERLLEDVEVNLSRTRALPIGQALKKGVAKRKSEIGLTRAKLAHQRWLETREVFHMIEAGRHLDAITDPFRAQADYDSLLAIHAFVAQRDVGQALRIVSSHSGDEHPSWRFSKAFLCAYQGNLRRAAREYRLVARVAIQADLLSEVEDFLYWVEVTDAEQHGYQTAFCLGCLNMYIKEDWRAALLDFERFIGTCPPDLHQPEKAQVAKWVETLRTRSAVGSD